MKKFLAMTLAFMMLLGTLSTAYGMTNYNDIKNTNWAYGSVKAMTEKGIIKGYPDGTFKPQNTLTYGEFIKMALIAATKNDVGNAEKPNPWALNYYNKALELKYFKETDISKSQLNSQIPRGDMALIISSIIFSLYGETKVVSTTTDGTEITLTYDVMKDSMIDITPTTKNKDAIVKAYAMGILTGYEDNTFKPEKTLTRAESAVVIHRFIDESKRELPKINQQDISGDVSKILEQKTNTGMTMGEVLGVKNAEQLKVEKPMTYYSFTTKTEEKKPIEEMITNRSEIKSATFDCKYYKNVDMKDIGLTSIKKTVDKYNCEQIEVLPGDGATNAFLIKDKKIVCNLSSADGEGTKKATLFFPNTAYYNGAWENTKLMDFDYIGFWGSTGDTIFLVANPF